MTPAVQYEIRVNGRLGALLSSALGASRVRHMDAGVRLRITSVELESAAPLSGRLYELGLKHESVRRLDARSGPAGEGRTD